MSRSLVGAVALLTVLACGGRSPVEPASSPAGVTPAVVALGDSLTAGPGLPPEQTYPALLQQKIRAAGYRYKVMNAGVSGDTSTDGLRRLDSALVPEAQVLILALGANDGLRGLPVDTLRSNLETIIERAQARDMRVLLCGMETLPTHGWSYTVAFHDIFPEIAQKYALPLMPFLLLGVAGNPDDNFPDGVHPNAAGARIIADNMWPYLEPLLH